jgi:multidrug resistance efflux pump
LHLCSGVHILTALSRDGTTVAAPPQPAPPVPSAAPQRRVFSRLLWIAVILLLVGLTVPFGYIYWSQRLTQSVTEDAFVEAHIVNLTPQSFSGHIIRFFVDKNDRVEQRQVVAEIDPVSYRDQVNLARSKKETAEAEWHRQQAGYDRLCQEVPIQIEMAKRTRDAA